MSFRTNFSIKNANPFFYVKYVADNYFPLFSKFKMVYDERINQIDNKCHIEVNCVNCNNEYVVTTNLNLIHFFNIQNCKNWVQKRIFYVIFVKRCLNCLQIKFSMFGTSHMRLELIKSSYEDKYLIFNNFFIKYFKIFFIKKLYLSKYQNNCTFSTISFLTVSRNVFRKYALPAEMCFSTYIKNVTTIK
jgi:hypothetical protein